MRFMSGSATKEPLGSESRYALKKSRLGTERESTITIFSTRPASMSSARGMAPRASSARQSGSAPSFLARDLYFSRWVRALLKSYLFMASSPARSCAPVSSLTSARAVPARQASVNVKYMVVWYFRIFFPLMMQNYEFSLNYTKKNNAAAMRGTGVCRSVQERLNEQI